MSQRDMISEVMEGVANALKAADGLIDELVQEKETVASNPRLALAVLNYIGARADSNTTVLRLQDELRLDDGDSTDY